MIIEIKIANYRSINEEQTLSFVAEKAVRHPDNLIARKGYKLLKAVALYGANASGKSNFVKAIGTAANFIRDSATRYNQGSPIPFTEPFRLESRSQIAPSRFEITFLIDKTIYRYGFSATAIIVIKEYLYTQKETAQEEKLLFERGWDSMRCQSTWNFGSLLEPVSTILEERTRSNALTLSVGALFNIPELKSPYSFFSDSITNLSMCNDKQWLVMRTAKLCAADKNLLNMILTLMQSAGIDIEELAIDPQDMLAADAANPSLPDEMRTYIEWLRQQPENQIGHRLTAKRKDRAGKTQDFDFSSEESEGTQRFYAIAGPLLTALANGSFLVIDELDSSLHSLLTRNLLEFFQSPEINTKGAQLLFTTHDPVLLDQVLFRRDQIWLTEQREGASEFYSLADVVPPPRNTESFLRNYLAGHYGGTPQIITRLAALELTETL